MEAKPASRAFSATRAVASFVGVFGGLMGMEHGFFETLQGNVAPGSLIIDAIGRQPNSVFQGSEPALTIVPNLFVTGILAICVGLLITIWAAAFIERHNAVLVLMLFSSILFSVGGGLAPLVIELIAAAIATWINQPHRWWRAHLSANVQHWLAELWPWPFVAFFVPSFINLQIAIFGNFFGVNNPSLLALIVLLIFGLLLLSVMSGFAYDIERQPIGINTRTF